MPFPGAVALTYLAACGAPDAAEAPAAPLLNIRQRQIVQSGSSWIIRYHITYQGKKPRTLTRSQISVLYDPQVANSRSRPHTVARRSRVTLSLDQGNRGFSTVLASPKPKERCREWVSLFLSQRHDDPVQHAPRWQTIALMPGQDFWLTLLLEHEHFLHGSYDPLLGRRTVEIRLGMLRLADSFRMDTEQALVVPGAKLNAPAKERLDTAQFHSPPDSLYLSADVPGYQYFRFDDVPVRYSSIFQLSFWYLVAAGSEGESRVRVIEYQDAPTAWYRLDGGGFDEPLPANGRWERFERTFRTLRDTTTMAIDFRIRRSDLGELWIDDVQLVALEHTAAKL